MRKKNLAIEAINTKKQKIEYSTFPSYVHHGNFRLYQQQNRQHNGRSKSYDISGPSAPSYTERH